MIEYDGLKVCDHGLSARAAVFEIDQSWFGTDAKYPGIWITEKVVNGEGVELGRTQVMVYPFEDPDIDGSLALSYGADYYHEGMTYTEATDRERRIDCFKAAELLYLHAAEKGNSVAYLNLGYVYRYDRCAGRYFQDYRFAETEEDYCRKYPREERAFECFSRAAKHGLAEGYYNLGDLYREGIGCEPDAKAAFDLYRSAFDVGKSDEPAIWGSIALRLGDAYEQGLGCSSDFSHAYEWYKKAETGLELAVREGEWFYERSLATAAAGVKRAIQELDGSY